MRIGLNLLYLIPNHVGGTQTYAEDLIHGLSTIDSENEYVLFVSKEAQAAPYTPTPNFRMVVCPIWAQNRKARYLYEQIHFPRLVKQEQISLLHSCGYVGPLFTPCPHIVTIHDLNYLAFGEQMEPLRRRALALLVPRVARRATKVHAISEFTKQEIITHLRVDSSKICVIHRSSRPKPSCSPDKVREVLCHLHIQQPYLLAFSSLSPHKNIPFLVEGFAKLTETYPHQLVLIGHTPPNSVVEQTITKLGLGDRVICTGYVDELTVAALLQAAHVLVFPSHYEGFGLPALEAQWAGVPLVCSHAGSLPEIAGEGAIYFDPCSYDSLLSALRQVLNSETLQAQLRQKGYANVTRFTWEKEAQKTLNLYQTILQSSKANMR
ncbi:MAG TPA: glycosyltransferase family 1 protein [Chthonomonas sp.]|uniref:glycosyltransferase family 4 protein n=1 Tax=Chthonomonas sp. TaxID=2282153 RepID=UPI002B4AB822|nr:glycosyltransferase family 1 protein [Chthonomonas sp.]HLI49176.1 glycosyltransferase family 1 protein [Chthonomonas sp.]